MYAVSRCRNMILLARCRAQSSSSVDSARGDLIGPPHAVSNLRPIVRRRPHNETEAQRRLRQEQERTHDWNQAFWHRHNSNFTKQRQEFVGERLRGRDEGSTLTADEMSVFYKQFLDENRQLHAAYNAQWYRRNFAALWLSLRATVAGWSGGR